MKTRTHLLAVTLAAVVAAGALTSCEWKDMPWEVREAANELGFGEESEDKEEGEGASWRDRAFNPGDDDDKDKADKNDDEDEGERRRRRRKLSNVAFSSLHASADVVDMHVDTLWYTHSRGIRVSDWGGDDGREAHPHQIRNGKVDAVFFSVWVPPNKGNPARQARQLVENYETQLVNRSDHFPATKPEDIERAGGGRRVAAYLGLEGTAALDGDPAAVDWFIDRGVRYVTLTWNEENPFGTGAKAPDKGLTDKGRQLVKRLNRRGVMVDVSHASRRTFWDAVTTSRSPVIASHSNTRALCDHPRNLDDLQLYALKESGGVAGLNFHAPFVKKGGSADVGDIVAHALHMKKIMGARHIGVGSDYEGDIKTPTDMRDIGWMARLTQRLLQDGFSEEEVVSVLGQNTLRVMGEVQGGKLSRRVTHKPARFVTKGADAAADGLFSTRWEADSPGDSIKIEVRERGLDRLTIWASTPLGRSSVKTVEVRTICKSGCGETKTVKVLGRDGPIRVPLKGVSGESRVRIEVKVIDYDGSRGAIAEVVPEIKG